MWNQLPAKYGKWNSVWRTYRRWCSSGLWEWAIAQLSSHYESERKIIALDASHIKVHQDATKHPMSAEDQKFGKTKGGQNTKISIIVNEHAIPVNAKLVCGNEHDSISAIDTLEGHIKDCYVLADKAYDTNKIRTFIAESDGTAVIPPKKNRKDNIEYDKEMGRLRHKVENCFAKLKRYRRICTRYEKLPETYMGFVSIAILVDWINV